MLYFITQVFTTHKLHTTNKFDKEKQEKTFFRHTLFDNHIKQKKYIFVILNKNI